ncbi:MAG TPA: amino acid adenylation domain-containing protein [Streptosporangiaceae bacterium]|nr:amino acid adenylation domain-containing protein [Streptosporangiaceae bacterium]
MDLSEFRPVPALIEDMADRYPERTAVCYGGDSLTYAQLDRLANGIAIAAAERGVAKGDQVAILLGNSLEQPACYLALMKLGAVFVPMDSGWPDERLRTALRVLSPRLILCAEPGDVPDEFRAASAPVAVDAIAPSSRRPKVPLTPADLCYGFFTSGTTGTPKCALNRHGGLANRLRFMTRWFGATGDDVVLQNSKHTFDSSLWQLLWPLITGGRTVLPASGEFLNLPQTIDTIAEHQVTTTDFVSSIFNALVAIVDGDERAQRKLSSLRYLIVGSEEINARAVHRMRAMLPRLEITNGYGPTETSIGMVFHLVTDADGDAIPIGRPIDNCYVAVLDANRDPVRRGAVGEIAIGGACVGAGYHGDPAATRKAFIPNRFGEQIPGDHLYLSGDFGYLDERGNLFFAGRVDFQVKIGGVRIELGEIEAAAQRCPGVYQAKALVAERDGMKSLALFAAGKDTLTADAVRDQLRRTLPRTSVPRYCIALPRLPLSEGGKVDWRELRAMLESRLDADAAGLAAAARPQSWLELTLRALRLALGQPDLHPGADFMEAGGDSLRALIAVRMLTDECGVPDLCVLDLIEHPTAERLAELIATREPSTAAAEAEVAQMDRDAGLPADSVIRTAPTTKDPTPEETRTVLVTGATGFVGSRLVHDLLARTDLRVQCLARAADDTQAAERVVGALAERGLWEPRFASRLEAYAGDLSQPNLGLDAAAWEHLARTADLVLHNGALVNLLFSYAAHRGANVVGTAEVLRLAMTHRPVPVHYVSTLSALQVQAMRGTGRLPEIDSPSPADPPERGYSRSKWVAERYLAQARRHGATITMLRLGEILPSEQHPHPNTRALTHLLLSAIYRLDAAPDAPILSDYTPVDYASERVVAAVLDRAAWGRALHVVHPESVDFTRVLDRAGATVTRTSCSDFLARLTRTAQETGDTTLAALAAMLPAPDGHDEAALRRELSDLLTDNASLYGKDECRNLERRWRLADEDLRGPMAAYRAYLATTTPPAQAGPGGAPTPAPAPAPAPQLTGRP